jgi:hypothetical protein
MKSAPVEWEGLRLAAKAADRGKAADELRPDFESQLTKLGYTPREIVPAFSLLTGSSLHGEEG